MTIIFNDDSNNNNNNNSNDKPNSIEFQAQFSSQWLIKNGWRTKVSQAGIPQGHTPLRR